MLHLDSFERIVERAQTLYSLPSVAADVVQLTSGEEVDAAKIRACIENDPALVVSILRVVNSSLFGLSQPVRDLGQALTLLGVKPLKLLVLGFSLPERLFADISGPILEHYWSTALTKAVAAREISETVWKRPGDEAFLGGLLHDLGLLVLIQQIGNPMINFVARTMEERAELTTLEREVLGFDHVQLTSRLLTQWNMPAALVEAIALSELPPEIETLEPPARTLPYILHLAGLVTRMLVDEDPEALPELLETGERLHHALSQEELEALVARIEENVGQLSDVLSLDLPQGLNYQEVVTRAHRQMALAAHDVTKELIQQRLGRIDGLKALDEMQTVAQAVNRIADTPVKTVQRTDEKQESEPHRASKPSPAAAPAQGDGAITAAAKVATEDGRLNAHLTAAVAACRQARCPLSLLLVDLDDYESLIFQLGVEGGRSLFDRLNVLCQQVDHPGSRCLVAGEGRLALVVPNCDRQEAAALGRDLVSQVQRWTQRMPVEDGPTASISVGAASVSCVAKNFPFRDLLDSADRCVYAAHHSGGNTVKSIEIY